MGCLKSLPISASSVDQFTPLDNAVYVPSMGKILGTMENQVVKFNATTGAYEASARAISPMYGPMGICLVNGVPWISCWNDPSIASSAAADHVRKDIFQINTTTLEAILPGTGLPGKGIFPTMQWEVGPRMIRDGGGTIVNFLYVVETQVYVGFIDTTNALVFNYANATDGLWCEQFGYDGVNYYTADPKDRNLYRHNALLTTRDTIYVDPHYPVGIEWTGIKAYAVGGDNIMIRADDWSLGTSTDIDLDALTGQVGLKPIRLRYNQVDSLLYIPVQNKDGVVVYNPAGGTAVWKSGFDSPVDVVFTPTKVFAVQSGLIGLKEVV